MAAPRRSKSMPNLKHVAPVKFGGTRKKTYIDIMLDLSERDDEIKEVMTRSVWYRFAKAKIEKESKESDSLLVILNHKGPVLLPINCKKHVRYLGHWFVRENRTTYSCLRVLSIVMRNTCKGFDVSICRPVLRSLCALLKDHQYYCSHILQRALMIMSLMFQKCDEAYSFVFSATQVLFQEGISSHLCSYVRRQAGLTSLDVQAVNDKVAFIDDLPIAPLLKALINMHSRSDADDAVDHSSDAEMTELVLEKLNALHRLHTCFPRDFLDGENISETFLSKNWMVGFKSTKETLMKLIFCFAEHIKKYLLKMGITVDRMFLRDCQIVDSIGDRALTHFGAIVFTPNLKQVLITNQKFGVNWCFPYYAFEDYDPQFYTLYDKVGTAIIELVAVLVHEELFRPKEFIDVIRGPTVTRLYLIIANFNTDLEHFFCEPVNYILRGVSRCLDGDHLDDILRLAILVMLGLRKRGSVLQLPIAN